MQQQPPPPPQIQHFAMLPQQQTQPPMPQQQPQQQLPPAQQQPTMPPQAPMAPQQMAPQIQQAPMQPPQPSPQIQQQQPPQHAVPAHGPPQATQTTHHQVAAQQQASSKKKRKTADKIIPSKVREFVPESQAYMDLLTFERKLDFTITRKRLDIQEALKRPMKQKRRLRIFITNTFFPVRPDPATNEELGVPSWELRVEGRLLEDPAKTSRSDNRMKRKFSSFFKSLVIELDNQLYGPDNHLVEWHRTPTTTETDGFQVKRPGDRNVKCTILLLLDHQPHQFKLDPRLARLLGKQTDTRPAVINALWQYIKTNKLQDAHEREFINSDKYLEQIFQCQRMKFSEIPSRISRLLNPPDPIIINHVIQNDTTNARMTSVFDIDVEVDDQLKVQMNNFMMSTANIHEIQSLDSKIYETVEAINQLKTNREFFLGFAEDPQRFTNKWLISQMQDLKLMTDEVGNPEEERRSDYFFQPWTQEAVCRYFYRKVQQRRAELEHSLTSRI